MKYRLLLPFFLLFWQETSAFGLFQSCFGVSPPIRVGNAFEICPEEAAYVAARAARVSEGFVSLLGESEEIKHEPLISICLSGGGYRAIIGSLGFLQGLEATGLLDVSTYVAAISGGAMCLINLLMRMKRQRIGLSEFQHILQERVALSLFDPTTFNMKLILKKVVQVIGKRFAFEPLDLWGVMLGDHFFGDLEDPHNISFEDIRSLLRAGDVNVPFPLFELIFSDAFPYEWVDVSPFTVSSDYLGGSIPTFAFDAPFENGVCSGLRRERSLEWFVALFGCAYNVSISDALIHLIRMLYDSWGAEQWLISAFTNITDKLNLHEHRVLASPIHNFMWKMPGVPFSDRKNIEMTDGGMSFNLPISPVLGIKRPSDILLIFDASVDAGIEEFSELQYAAEYANRKGLPFPSLENPKKLDEHVLLFEDDVEGTPAVFYFANPIDSSVINAYDADEFERVRGAVESLVLENKESVVDFIRHFVV